MVWLMRYSLSPAPASRAALQWPATNITRPVGATLVTAVHPYCPCTRASLEELSRVLAKSNGRLAVRILFYRPLDKPSSWARTGTWKTAAALPATQVIEDTAGREARRFGLRTSGETALYDARGQLVFRGGITSARGHAGDNYGADAIVQFVNAKVRSRSLTPVFGCSLLSSDTVRNVAVSQ